MAGKDKTRANNRKQAQRCSECRRVKQAKATVMAMRWEKTEANVELNGLPVGGSIGGGETLGGIADRVGRESSSPGPLLDASTADRNTESNCPSSAPNDYSFINSIIQRSLTARERLSRVPTDTRLVVYEYHAVFFTTKADWNLQTPFDCIEIKRIQAMHVFYPFIRRDQWPRPTSLFTFAQPPLWLVRMRGRGLLQDVLKPKAYSARTPISSSYTRVTAHDACTPICDSIDMRQDYYRDIS